MKKKTTLILIEDDPIACKEMQDYFDTCEDMHLVETTDNSTIGVQLVASHVPNVVLLDLELHFGGGNGFMFLHELRQMALTNPPFIIVTTQNMSEATLTQARALGADLILTKYDACYSPEYVASTVRLMKAAILRKNTTISQLVDKTPAQVDNQVKLRIQREMELIGINPKNKGYTYLTDAIQIYMENPGAHISRSLVNIYHKSEKSIERAMQNAIKRAWDTNDINDLLKYYTAYIRSDKGYPTLMEFICYYANKIGNTVTTEKLGGTPWQEVG